MNCAALLLLLATGPQVLLDEVFNIPAAEWRYVPVVLNQLPVTLECQFRVVSGSAHVRAALANREGLERLRLSRSPEFLAATAFRAQGNFRYPVREPDEYAVILENSREGGAPAVVELRVSLDFSARGQPQVRYLSPQRRLVVILVSLAVFLAIVTYSGWKLLGVLR